MKEKKKNSYFDFQFHEINLSDGQEISSPSGIEQVQLLRVGTFTHPKYGKFAITTETLRKLKENFDNDTRRIKVACDYYHDAHKVAAGWFQEVNLREDDQELWVTMAWTPGAKQKIEDKELRYISADFDFNYTDAESGTQFGPTLLGAGLTNRPHIKEMQIILNENKSEENQMEFEKLLEMLGNLSDDQKKMVMEKLGVAEEKEIEEEKEEMSEELKEMEKEKVELSEKIEKLESEKKELAEKIETTEKEKSFTILLSEGKAVEAQRESYLAGDMDKFIENAVALNLDEKGHGEGTEEKTEEKTEELTPETASEQLDEQATKLMETENVTHGQALSMVLDLEENKKLVEICQSK